MLDRRVARIFRGGGVRVGSEIANLPRGVRGHAPPGKFYKFWITLDYISHVFVVEKERKTM